MRWIKQYLSNNELEILLFRAVLLITIPYFSSSIFYDLTSSVNNVFLFIDMGFLGICLMMIALSLKSSYNRLLINIFCFLMLAGFTFYWMNSQGLAGGGAYVFPVVSVLIILITNGLATIIYSIILVILVIFLPTELIPVSGETTYNGLLFDFILNLFMFSILILVFKRSLDKERIMLELQKAEIQDLNNKLSLKSTELELYNRDVDAIRKNLEMVAQRHSNTLEKENEKIIEYAFINAHLVRAPLTNIIGLSQLKSENEYLQRINQRAIKLDEVLHRISHILHSK